MALVPLNNYELDFIISILKLLQNKNNRGNKKTTIRKKLGRSSLYKHDSEYDEQIKKI